MARRINLKLKTPLFRSLIAHSILLAMILLVILFEPRMHQEEPIEIETLSFQSRVKKTFHQAIHTIGIPHDEPRDEVVSQESKNFESRQADLNAKESSLEESAGGLPPNEMQKYILEIVNRIDRVKQYPKEARFNEQEGTVEVSLFVSTEGMISKIELSKKTPFDSLNQAALSAVQKIGALPPLPVRADGTPMTGSMKLYVPIRFQLK